MVISHTQRVVIVAQFTSKGFDVFQELFAKEFVIIVHPHQSVVISQYTLKGAFASGLIQYTPSPTAPVYV